MILPIKSSSSWRARHTTSVGVVSMVSPETNCESSAVTPKGHAFEESGTAGAASRGFSIPAMSQSTSIIAEKSHCA
jgi:hypothetical protein